MSNRNQMPRPQDASPEVANTTETETVAAAPKASGIEVMATDKGFFGGVRRKEGQRFTVPSMKMLGSWMKCVDPKAEIERQKMLADKKKSLAGK